MKAKHKHNLTSFKPRQKQGTRSWRQNYNTTMYIAHD